MKKYLFVLTVLLFPVIHLHGQEEKEEFKKSAFHTPHDVIENHLKYLQDETYDLEQATKSFVKTSKYTDKQLQNMAIELKQILDGSGNYVRLEDLPKDVDYKDDTASFRNTYVLFEEFPDIYVEKILGSNQWFYSMRTLAEIDRIHKEVYPYGIDKLLNQLPKLGSKKYLGFKSWQLIGVFLLILVAFTLHKSMTYVIRHFIVGLLKKYGKVEVAKTFILPVAKPFSMFVVIGILGLFIPILQLPATIGRYVIFLLNGLVPLYAAMFFFKLVDVFGAYMMNLAHKSENTLDEQLMPLVRKALKTFVFVIGALAVLKGLGTDLLPLLTGLSIGGLAFALAAQDTLKNFFGSLMIFMDKPFHIGDWITSGSDIDGTVEEVGFRSTRIRTFRDSVIYVPNHILSNASVDNHGLRKYRRFFTRLSVTYDTPTTSIEVFVKGIVKIVEAHPNTRKDYHNIFLNDYAASSLDIMLYVFFEVPDWNAELRCRQEIMLEVNNLAEHLGVRFAFPTQTLHVETLPGQLSLTPKDSNTLSEKEKSLEAFFKK
jgi:MscS family membrane protein